MRLQLALGVACLALVSLAIAPGGIAPPSTVSHVAGGTLVVKEQFQPAAVDSGALGLGGARLSRRPA